MEELKLVWDGCVVTVKRYLTLDNTIPSTLTLNALSHS